MPVRPGAALVLGMLRLGATSGYAIKKAVDSSTRFFWATSLSQVYPELARLEERGLVERSADPHGARERSAYAVTAAGEEALRAWLRSPVRTIPQFRVEPVLRLFLADALPREDQLALVRGMRAQAARVEEEIRTQIVPAGQALEAATGLRFPGVVARLGADLYGFGAQWLEALERELTEGEPGA